MTKKFLRRLAGDTRATTAIEYGILAMLIGIALLATMLTMGNSVNSHYETVGTDYHDAANAARD